MRYINELLDNIKKALAVDEVIVEVNGDDLVKNEHIVVEKLRNMNGGRYHSIGSSAAPCRINIKTKNAWLFQTNLAEYPACCGKTIMYKISVCALVYKDGELVKPMKPEQTKIVVENSIEIIGVISKILRYGSMDFVVSETEQFLIYQAVHLKPRETFINPRLQGSPHTCHSYSLDLNKFGEVV